MSQVFIPLTLIAVAMLIAFCSRKRAPKRPKARMDETWAVCLAIGWVAFAVMLVEAAL